MEVLDLPLTVNWKAFSSHFQIRKYNSNWRKLAIMSFVTIGKNNGANLMKFFPVLKVSHHLKLGLIPLVKL